MLEGMTTDPLALINLTLSATNSKGTAQSALNINIQNALSAPEISAGSVIERLGRGVHLRGILSDSGGSANQVTIYYGQTDAGQIVGDWNQSMSLGSKDQGAFDAHIRFGQRENLLLSISCR